MEEEAAHGAVEEEAAHMRVETVALATLAEAHGDAERMGPHRAATVPHQQPIETLQW